jgi:steroid 5-alpha reductase family enzyme
MTLLNTLLTLTNFRSPFLRTLVPSIGLAYAIQAGVAVPSIALQSERFYDLSGSLTYLSCTALSLYLPTLRARAAAETVSAGTAALPGFPSLLASLASKGGVQAWNWRQVVLSAAVAIWATRRVHCILSNLEAGLSTNMLTVGTFLFSRITSEDGRDSRFDEIRKSPPKFLGAFFAQATWVSLCLLPVLAVNSIPATTLSALPFLALTDVIGVALFVGGLSFEATADKQKSQWMEEKKNKKHNEDFLTRGLWSKSRHPNYFGESTLWTGIATVAAGVLVTNVGQSGMGFSGSLSARLGALAMAGVSPAFVTFLLLKVCFQNVLTSRFSSADSLARFLVFLSARPSTTSVTVTVRTTSSGRRYVLYVVMIGYTTC